MEGSKVIANEPGKWRQFLAALIVNLSALGYGTAIGFCSPSMTILQSPESPLGTTPLTDHQISWLNTGMAIGALSILPFCSLISEKIGRKMTGCLLAVPQGVCWFLTIFSSNFSFLFIARYLSGIGGAMCVFLVSIYISEISSDHVRGLLGTFLVFAINIGVLLGYTVGATLSFQLSAICALTIPVIYLGLFVLMPETPVYLIRNNRIAEATRSLMWLRNNDKSTVDNELLRLQASVNENSNQKSSVGLKDLFRDRGTTKGFVVAVVLMGGQQTCGITAMVIYTSMIFKLAGSSLTPDAAAIVFGAIQVFGSWLSTLLMERAGRRPLILISCMGMAITLSVLGGFLYMQSKFYDVSGFTWIPITALSIYAVVYCLGMGPAPFIVASEVFSSDISGLANSVAQFFMWVLVFLIVRFFATFISLLGMHGCFFLLASFCMFTFLFTCFFVPETKGRSIESILDELNGYPEEFQKSGYIKASDNVIREKIHPTHV